MLTKLPEDILEAVSSSSSTKQKQLICDTKSLKPAAADTETEETKLSDDDGKLEFSLLSTA